MEPMMDRRTFLLASLAMATSASAQTRAPETLIQWMNASPQAREGGVQQCLERIQALDSSIQAWVQVAPQQPTGSGKLNGIPFGAKDIFETKGLATEYGSHIYKGRIGTTDADIVRDLRERGGILLGKTHTAAFAHRTPAPTRNPRDLSRTPGGSSSGSAAAVAAGMVPFATGTQTGGSVLRPASFCGVTGFKATYGLLPMNGVLPFSKSLDTLGFFTHTAADMLALWDALGHATGAPEHFDFAAPDPMPDVDAVMADAFQSALSRLRGSGVSIKPIDIAPVLTQLVEAQRTVMYYEGAQFHEQRYREYGERLDAMAELVREGLEIPASKYDEALRFIAQRRVEVSEIYKSTPVILVPAAVGPAPPGLSSTGDSRMNASWTALGTPAISIPMPVGNNLPLGLQLTAGHGQDARVIQTAVRLEKIFSS
jgi:Asp-tRNA(Asn)/Glu-tRNA(Gln) amidotransferase A subunit family amidase